MEVLRAATLHGAEAIGYAQDLGSVETGKLADLVVLAIDPACGHSQHELRRYRHEERRTLRRRCPQPDLAGPQALAPPLVVGGNGGRNKSECEFEMNRDWDGGRDEGSAMKVLAQESGSLPSGRPEAPRISEGVDLW
jgi:hypothetical protein